MHKFKKIKKGYVIVITLIFGLLCMSITLYCYKLEMNTRIINNLIKQNLLEEDYIGKNREFLMTRLNRAYEQFASDELGSEGNMIFFTNLNIIYEDSELFYDFDNNLIILCYPYDQLTVQHDSYTYQIENQSIHLNFKKTSFVERE